MNYLDDYVCRVTCEEMYRDDYDEEWEMDNEDIKEGYVLAYVWNTTVDYFSEFGSIAVQGRFGGLVRIG